jgi:hypothetical protein
VTAKVELTFASDGYTFMGKWKDDSNGQWGDWSGRRIESVTELLAMPLRLIVRKRDVYSDRVRARLPPPSGHTSGAAAIQVEMSESGKAGDCAQPVVRKLVVTVDGGRGGASRAPTTRP